MDRIIQGIVGWSQTHLGIGAARLGDIALTLVGWIFRQAVANYTAGFNFIWDEIAVMVTFESDWKRAKEILQEIAERHTVIQDEEASRELRRASRKYMIFFEYLTPIVWTRVADSGVVLTMRYLCEPRRRRSTAGNI